MDITPSLFKKHIRRLARLSLIAGIFIGIIATSAVSCSNWKSVSYKTAGTTVITADMAMKVWAVYVTSGRANSEQENRVRLAYDSYRATMNALIDIGKISTTASDTSAFDIVIFAANAAQSNLVSIINAYTK